MNLRRLRDAWDVLVGRKVATTPPQLIANPSFQSGMTKWYTSGTGTGWTFTGNSFSE